MLKSLQTAVSMVRVESSHGQAAPDKNESPQQSSDPRDAAEQFVREETAFQLGFLPTEQSHPLTSDLSHQASETPSNAVARILDVDSDIAPVARRAVSSPEFDCYVSALRAVAEGTGRVCFSGCGSTGRLAVILESIWRTVFADTGLRERATSIMTGGDRALIRAVETFEDYPAFGARQVADAGLREGDVLVAISEGGETSSVIGTAEEAARRGCNTFFVYNNPTGILCESIPRSRRVIENPAVTSIDLFSGPMALSGSTRMQATTLEMLVLGIGMEEALGPHGSASKGERLSKVDAFVRMLRSMRSQHNIEAIARVAELEADIYRAGGLVTYFAEDYLLDIFSDTTERSPTFMLPPFRPSYDRESPRSWAFAKDPVRASNEAWRHMLKRPVNGLTWNSDDYRQMDVPSHLAESPPSLDSHEINSYQIGAERDTSRTETVRAAAIWTDVGGSLSHTPRRRCDPSNPDNEFHEHWLLSFNTAGDSVSRAAFGESLPAHRTIALELELPESPIHLFHHLAVKLVFNTFSTTTMAQLGRIHGNWMVQLDPTNKKLIDRGTRIIAHLAGISYPEACARLHEAIAEHREPESTRADVQSPAGDSPVVTALRRLEVPVSPGR